MRSSPSLEGGRHNTQTNSALGEVHRKQIGVQTGRGTWPRNSNMPYENNDKLRPAGKNQGAGDPRVEAIYDRRCAEQSHNPGADVVVARMGWQRVPKVSTLASSALFLTRWR